MDACVATGDTLMGDVVGPYSSEILALRDSMNLRAWRRTRTTVDIAQYLVALERFSSPEKTVREFLMSIVCASRAMGTEWAISKDDVDDILRDQGEDELSVSDMIIHTFDVEHLLVYFDIKYGGVKVKA